MKVSLFDYQLPPDRIAQVPADPRDSSRLLVLNRQTGAVEHSIFREVGRFLRPGDLLVLNDTRVIPARVFGLRRTLGKVEALFLDPAGDRLWRALLGSGGRILPGERLSFADGRILVDVASKDPDGVFTLRIVEPADLLAALEDVGHLPLPPYIRRAGSSPSLATLDRDRYQTVYACAPGAVAAPTAGLHFTPDLLARLESAGVRVARVTLHVGVGTFRPVKVDDLEDHVMHAEYFEVAPEAAAALNSAREEHRRVIAVGTTSARVLETLPQGTVEPQRGHSRIFIHPPYRFHRVDAMITNFHLPKSTLLMMISAFAGREPVLAAYSQAIRLQYRFFSYGDAMLILCPPQ